MRIVDWKSLDAAGRGQVLARPIAATDDKVRTRVRRILDDVCVRGDAALVEYTRRFDKVALDGTLVAKETAKLAWAALPEDERAALRQAKANIEAYHKPQSPQPYTVKPMDGVVCRRVVRAIESVGLYVPGGSAPLVSSVLMLAIPAKLAGVKRVVMVSPPAADGGLDPRILAAAYLCGVDEIYAVGGAQAIGALAYGTASIDKVMKIFGPGNIYVAEAKAQVASAQGGPAIDLPAGPSEVMVLADAQADAGFVAADLLAQAEHDPLAQCLCVCSSEDLARRIMAQIEAQLPALSRQDIARASLAHGRILISGKRAQMIDIANQYAPEHLIVQLQNPDDIVEEIHNAGSIFLGPWAPESVGDYASGPNHTLPTYGAARAYSGVGVEGFVKYISVQSLSAQGLQALAPSVETLAMMEGLDAHKKAVSLRLNRRPS